MFDSLRGMAGMAGLMKDCHGSRTSLNRSRTTLSTGRSRLHRGSVTTANGKLRIVRITFDHDHCRTLDPSVPEDGRRRRSVAGACNAATRLRR